MAIQEVLEPEDETYSGNRELVEGGIQPLLLQVLADGSAEVRAAGARTLELLSQQSPAVLARLADAHTLGNFNPVQETLGDRDIIRCAPTPPSAGVFCQGRGLNPSPSFGGALHPLGISQLLCLRGCSHRERGRHGEQDRSRWDGPWAGRKERSSLPQTA